MDQNEFSKEVVDRLDSGSFASRKFILTIGSLILITIICILAGFFSGLAAMLPTFVGGVLGILSLYFTGNIMQTYVSGKVALTAPIVTKLPEKEGEV